MEKQQKIYSHINNLKLVFAVLVILGHTFLTAVNFAEWPFILFEPNEFLTIGVVYLMWLIMPGFFLISGWVNQSYIMKKGLKSFIWMRVRRVEIPFVLSLLLLIPLMDYQSCRYFGSEADCYLSWTRLEGYIYHLWFLLKLTLFSIAHLFLYPLFKTKWKRLTVLVLFILLQLDLLYFNSSFTFSDPYFHFHNAHTYGFAVFYFLGALFPLPLKKFFKKFLIPIFLISGVFLVFLILNLTEFYSVKSILIALCLFLHLISLFHFCYFKPSKKTYFDRFNGLTFFMYIIHVPIIIELVVWFKKNELTQPKWMVVIFLVALLTSILISIFFEKLGSMFSSYIRQKKTLK